MFHIITASILSPHPHYIENDDDDYCIPVVTALRMMMMITASLLSPHHHYIENDDDDYRIPVVHGGPRVPPQSSLCIRRAEQKHGHEKLNKGNFDQRAFLGMNTQEGHYLI